MHNVKQWIFNAAPKALPGIKHKGEENHFQRENT